MRYLSIFTLFMLLVMSSLAAAAEKLPEPSVEYSADSHYEVNGMAMQGKMYHAKGGKMRQEFDMSGMSQDGQRKAPQQGAAGSRQVTIVRQDKKVAWILMDEQKAYLEARLDDKNGQKQKDVRDCTYDHSPLGSERMEGLSTTKSSITMKCPDDLSYKGTMWIAMKEGILVKLDATGKDKDGKDIYMKMSLKNISIKPQPASLFEIPTGYSKLDFSGIGGMIKSANEQARKEQERQAAEERKRREEEQKNSSQQQPSDSGRSYTSQPRSSEEGKSDDNLVKDAVKDGTRSGIKESVSEGVKDGIKGLFKKW